MEKKGMIKLTKIQKKVFEYLKESILENGYPPSLGDIADEIGLASRSSAKTALDKLERVGLISRDSNNSRTIKINDDAFNLARRMVYNVPVLKDDFNINDVFCDDNIIDYFPVPSDMIENGEFFIAKLHGNDMINAAMLDGDNLLFNRQNTANSDDIILAYVSEIDTCIVRRLVKDNHGYYLTPENKAATPIFAERIKIIGKVIGVYRKI